MMTRFVKVAFNLREAVQVVFSDLIKYPFKFNEGIVVKGEAVEKMINRINEFDKVVEGIGKEEYVCGADNCDDPACKTHGKRGL